MLHAIFLINREKNKHQQALGNAHLKYHSLKIDPSMNSKRERNN